MFTVYRNYSVEIIGSCVRLFSDGAVVYKKAATSKHSDVLQEDLQRINEWCGSWQLSLNVEKCNIMRIHRGRNPLQYDYAIGGKSLEAVTKVKYLGVTIRSDLKWNDHIKQIVGKAGARLRFIGRILKKCNSSTKEVAYKTLVRPILEYCSSVWDPYQVGLIEEIDMIQRRAARFVMGTFSRQRCSTREANTTGKALYNTERFIIEIPRE